MKELKLAYSQKQKEREKRLKNLKNITEEDVFDELCYRNIKQ